MTGMRRLEPAAITGVMSREVANFRTFWKATTFSSVLEPIIYLLAFGVGLGSTIVKQVDGLCNGAIHEVGDDHRSLSRRERHGVTPSAAGNVDDQGVWRQRKASIDDPARWCAIRFPTALHVSRIPIGALAARVLDVAHR